MKQVALTEAEAGEVDPEERLARLERMGILRRATAPIPREILLTDGPEPTEGGSVLEALLEERRKGR